MKRVVLTSFALVALLLLAGFGWLAWTRWTPLVEYRMRRNDAETRELVRRYLSGQEAFEPAASRLAVLYQRKTELMVRLPLAVPPRGGGSLTAVTIATPEDVSPDDPRLLRLSERAMEIMMRAEPWASLQRMQRERSRGP
jgi:hypothetical protein